MKLVDMADTPFDFHWYDYRLDAMSLYYVKSTLEPNEPFFVAAIPEEAFKFLVLFGYAYRHFESEMHGVVYGVAASMGFALLENIQYVFFGGGNLAFTRAVYAVPSHALYGVFMGYFAAKVRFSDTGKIKNLALAFLVPMALHTLYDFFLMVRTPDIQQSGWGYVTVIGWNMVLFTEIFIGFKILRKTASAQSLVLYGEDKSRPIILRSDGTIKKPHGAGDWLKTLSGLLLVCAGGVALFLSFFLIIKALDDPAFLEKAFHFGFIAGLLPFFGGRILLRSVVKRYS